MIRHGCVPLKTKKYTSNDITTITQLEICYYMEKLTEV